MHYWHDIETGPDVPNRLTTVVEIPRNERNKYELDKDLGLFRLDRILHSAVHYPGDYGFLPRTLADDGDPLDVLIIMTLPVFPGCLVEVRPLGLFRLVDRGLPDEKIIAVPCHDPYAEELHDIGDLAAHTLKEIEHFFEVYKDLEGIQVRSRGYDGLAAAKKIIVRSVEAYRRRGAPRASPVPVTRGGSTRLKRRPSRS